MRARALGRGRKKKGTENMVDTIAGDGTVTLEEFSSLMKVGKEWA